MECKATAVNDPIFTARVLAYLRLTGRKLGIVLNFGMEKVRDGFVRVANGVES